MLAVLASGLLLAGCGSGPSQVGAAVIIGDKAVSVDQVQGLIDKAVREQPFAQQLAKEHKLDLLGREVVRQLLLHDVILRAAQGEKLAVNESQLAQVMEKDPLAGPASADPKADPAQNLYEAVVRTRDHREALTDTLLQQELALKYLPSLSVTFDYAAVTGPQGPDGSYPKLPAGEAAALRDEVLVKAKQLASGSDTATLGLKSGTQAAVQAPALAASALFGVPINTVAAFQPDANQEFWVVALVRKRTSGVPVSVDQAPQPTASDLIAIGRRLLEPYLDDVSFKVNPRYGVWDVVGMDLASNASTLKGIVLPVHGAAQPKQ